MAVAREQEKCFKCGEPLKAIHADRGKDFMGDTFQAWDYAEHQCKEEAILKQVPIKTLKERDDLELLQLVLELYARASQMGASKEVHDASVEARRELEQRLILYGGIKTINETITLIAQQHCNHHYLITDPDWKRCQKCGNIAPVRTKYPNNNGY